jgi:hypothetical protein
MSCIAPEDDPRFRRRLVVHEEAHPGRRQGNIRSRRVSGERDGLGSDEGDGLGSEDGEGPGLGDGDVMPVDSIAVAAGQMRPMVERWALSAISRGHPG